MWLRGNSLLSTIFTYGGMRSFSSSQIRLGKMAARQFVEQQARFERRTGQPVLDAPHGVAQIQQARRLLALLQQAQQAAAQQRRSWKDTARPPGPQQKDGGTVGQRLERRVELRQIVRRLR